MSKRDEDASDAGKRLSDAYNLHRIADPEGSIGKWFAARLTDGSSDNVLYDSKSEAVRHQHHNEMYFVYVQVGPWQMMPSMADSFLNTHRRMYDKGIRLADPNHSHGGRDMIMRASEEDQKNQLRALFVGDR